jgi:C1A family cysteine protease
MRRSSTILNRRTFALQLAATLLPTSGLGQVQATSPIRYARGAQPPARLKWFMSTQNEAAATLNRILHADPDFLKTSPRTTVTPAVGPRLDWRDSRCVTPVKDQGRCGSCWAFAAIGAYESAYAITNGKWAHVSEQEALDCTFGDANCVAGGWHQSVFLYMQLYGLVGTDRYYYTATKGACTANFSRTYFVANWGYVSQSPDLIATEAALKQAIAQYGPVASGVQTENWDSYWRVDERGAQNPNWYTDFPNGVFNGNPSRNLQPSDTDHEVVIIGWDDNVNHSQGKGAWIIKNSWGPYWGDAGYMKLPYGCNNIGIGASWVTAMPNQLGPALAEKLQLMGQDGAIRKLEP